MENKEIEIESEEVLNILEKYRKLLSLERFYLKEKIEKELLKRKEEIENKLKELDKGE